MTYSKSHPQRSCRLDPDLFLFQSPKPPTAPFKWDHTSDPPDGISTAERTDTHLKGGMIMSKWINIIVQHDTVVSGRNCISIISRYVLKQEFPWTKPKSVLFGSSWSWQHPLCSPHSVSNTLKAEGVGPACVIIGPAVGAIEEPLGWVGKGSPATD